MRASRLLRMLLLLQNRGRMRSGDLAVELEVCRRTILRDVDAMTEAGLPVIVHRGQGGGIELGFDYRTRLTGLDADEADAMAMLLSLMPPEVVDLGLASAARRAQAKMREAFPDQTRARMAQMAAQFHAGARTNDPDPRRAALARAIKEKRIVRLRARTARPLVVHPAAMSLSEEGWVLIDARDGRAWPESSWADVNVSMRRFASQPATARDGTG